MSVERSLEAWEEVQRQGFDFADRLAQGFTGLLHSSPPFAWSTPPTFHKPNYVQFHVPTIAPSIKAADLLSFGVTDNAGVSAIFDIGSRLGQAGADLGACINGLVQQFFRNIPVPPVPLPFRHAESGASPGPGLTVIRSDAGAGNRGEEVGLDRHMDGLGSSGGKFGEGWLLERVAGADDSEEDDGFAVDLNEIYRHFGRPQGSINITSTYDSRTHDLESSLAARTGVWRAEVSHGSSASRTESSPFFLVQLGPVLFVQDTSLLLPLHASNNRLLWYGYDHKNGIHSLCPAVWSKHRRWLLMSMICLNPAVACSYLDVQFPNGQVTYVAGEGLNMSAFLPVFGGLLQAQGQYPGETRLSFSCKNKWGTHITPMVQLPDKSFSLGVVQSLAWQRSGLLYRPTLQLSLCPTFGGSNPGIRAEVVHAVKEDLTLICGCSNAVYPAAYASLSVGRSKWNGNVGTSGVVLKVEKPLGTIGRPSFSVQINSGVEF